MSEKNLTLFIIVFILIISFISFLFSPYFQLRKIKISGTKEINEDELKKELSDHVNQNIWLINTNNIKNKLLEKGYIKHLDIEKILPDTIIIKIQERTPLAKINNDGKFLLINSNGFIIDEGSIHQFEVPEIKGAGYVFQDNIIKFSSQFAKIVQALSKLDLRKIKYIKEINKKDSKIEIILKGNIKAELGEIEKISKKFAILDILLDKLKNDNEEIEYIDLSIPSKPVFKNR